MKRIVQASDAPQPIGPYNQAVAVGNLLFTAGQISMDPQTGDLCGKNVREQTRWVLNHLQAILREAGSDVQYVIKTVVFLKSMNDFAAMNEVYADYFKENAPARSVVEVCRLPKNALVKIECIAGIPE